MLMRLLTFGLPPCCWSSPTNSTSQWGKVAAIWRASASAGSSARAAPNTNCTGEVNSCARKLVRASSNPSSRPHSGLSNVTRGGTGQPGPWSPRQRATAASANSRKAMAAAQSASAPHQITPLTAEITLSSGSLRQLLSWAPYNLTGPKETSAPMRPCHRLELPLLSRLAYVTNPC
jgi:hypothetical protein